MLRNRVLTAAIIVPPVALALWWGGIPAVCLAVLVCALGNFEYFSFATPFRQKKVLQFTLVNLLPALAYLFYGWPGFAVGVLLAVVLNVLLSVVSIETEAHLFEFHQVVPQCISGVAYPGILLSFLVVAVGELPGALTLWTVAVVAAADTFAYFGGRAIGGIKLAPRISPQKTVAGVCCGVLGAALLGIGLMYLLLEPLPWYGAALAASFVALLSVFGDLAESLSKRISGVKDSGDLLPGHGGVLDRVDGLLFAVPALYLVIGVFVQ